MAFTRCCIHLACTWKFITNLVPASIRIYHRLTPPYMSRCLFTARGNQTNDETLASHQFVFKHKVIIIYFSLSLTTTTYRFYMEAAILSLCLLGKNGFNFTFQGRRTQQTSCTSNLIRYQTHSDLVQLAWTRGCAHRHITPSPSKRVPPSRL
jgi:hypothetical protein